MAGTGFSGLRLTGTVCFHAQIPVSVCGHRFLLKGVSSVSELEKLTDLFKSTADEAAIDLMQWWHALLQEDSDVVKREYMLTMCSALSDNLAELCKLSREFEKMTEKED